MSDFLKQNDACCVYVPKHFERIDSHNTAATPAVHTPHLHQYGDHFHKVFRQEQVATSFDLMWRPVVW
jgi:hypothetical protein